MVMYQEAHAFEEVTVPNVISYDENLSLSGGLEEHIDETSRPTTLLGTSGSTYFQPQSGGKVTNPQQIYRRRLTRSDNEGKRWARRKENGCDWSLSYMP